MLLHPIPPACCVIVTPPLPQQDTGTTVFHPHARPVSGLVVHPFLDSSVFTCSYDGSVRTLDLTKQVWDEVHVDEDDMFSCLALSRRGDSLWVSARVRFAQD